MKRKILDPSADFRMTIRIVSFCERVLAIVRKIPMGSVMTYKDVARAAGSPGAARAVGSIMKSNYDPSIPCHRVIRSDGLIGEYNRGKKRKRELLTHEGAV